MQNLTIFELKTISGGNVVISVADHLNDSVVSKYYPNDYPEIKAAEPKYDNFMPKYNPKNDLLVAHEPKAYKCKETGYIDVDKHSSYFCRCKENEAIVGYYGR